MKKLSIIIMWVISFSGCLNEFEPPKKTYYVIEDELSRDGYEASSEVPPLGYYTKYNIIIIDSSGQLFYHNEYFSCGTGVEAGDPPRPINLKNGKLKKMESLDALVKEITFSYDTPKLTMIAVDSDTIRNAVYFSMVKQLREIDECYIIRTRKMTKDEKEAVELKYWE
jgi:hypothetical protein